MNIVLDVGNSAAKVGIFDHHKLLEKHVFNEMEDLRVFLKNFSGANIIISSVRNEPTEILAGIVFAKVVVLAPGLPLPITNNYETPTTLGVDRLAAACGAAAMKPFSNCLVIDAGSCITYDFVDRNQVYYGGAIAPGMKMRFKAMNAFTARLPLVEPSADPPLIGSSTIACMQSGVVNGMIMEIEGMISAYSTKFEDLIVFLTGGDSLFFENKLKASIFAIPELVLGGLNSILLYNISE